MDSRKQAASRAGYEHTRKLEHSLIDAGVPVQEQPYKAILENFGELEHQGMEGGVYSVTLSQYREVAEDIILCLFYSQE